MTAEQRRNEDLALIKQAPKRLTEFEKKELVERGLIDLDGEWTPYATKLKAEEESKEKAESLNVIPVKPEVEAQVMKYLKEEPPETENKVDQTRELPEPGSDAHIDILKEIDNDKMPTLCPHCGWDIKLSDEAEITEDDKRNFMRHMLGGSGTRFTKTYKLLGGQLSVTFRSRSIKETELTYQQLANDRKYAKLYGEIEMGLMLTQYQMAVSLKSIDGEILVPNKELSEYLVTPIEEATGITPVAKLHEEVLKSMQEGMFNVLVNTFRKFEYTYIHLQAQVLNPDFWQETPGQV